MKKHVCHGPYRSHATASISGTRDTQGSACPSSARRTSVWLITQPYDEDEWAISVPPRCAESVSIQISEVLYWLGGNAAALFRLSWHVTWSHTFECCGTYYEVVIKASESRMQYSVLAGTQLARLPARPRNAACGAAGVQMNLFSRLFRVARSYANALGKSLFKPAQQS